MSKEAITFVIDVSKSMGKTDPGKAQTRLQESLEGVKLMIEAKILQSKQNEVGIVLFGASNSDNPLHNASGGYENVILLSAMDRPAVSLTGILDEIEIGEDSGDLIDGLGECISMLPQSSKGRPLALMQTNCKPSTQLSVWT